MNVMHVFHFNLTIQDLGYGKCAPKMETGLCAKKLGDKYVGREIKYRNTHNENRRLLRLGFWYILILRPRTGLHYSAA